MLLLICLSFTLISQFDSIKIGISFAGSFKRASSLDLSFFLAPTRPRNGLVVSFLTYGNKIIGQ